VVGQVFASAGVTDFAPSFSGNTSLAIPFSQIQAAPRTHTLTSILITPQNRTLEAPLDSLNLFATGYYSDGAVEDLTGQVSWSIVQAAGDPTLPSNELPRINASGSLAEMILFEAPGIYDYVVTATDPTSGISAVANFRGSY
jgi:hypothetical protein